MSHDTWALIFAAAALIVASVSPLIVGWFSRQWHLADLKRREKKANDLAIHDGEVAKEALRIAKQLLEQNKSLNADTAAKAAQMTKVGDDLSNGIITLSMQRELDATQMAMLSIQRVIDLKRDNGITVEPETYHSLTAMEEQYKTLSAKIDKRRSEAEAKSYGTY